MRWGTVQHPRRMLGSEAIESFDAVENESGKHGRNVEQVRLEEAEHPASGCSNEEKHSYDRRISDQHQTVLEKTWMLAEALSEPQDDPGCDQGLSRLPG